MATLPAALDRSTTARLVEDLLPSNAAGAFAVSMIWGHGWSGYGPYRTARVLTGMKRPAGEPVSPDVESRLNESIAIARASGPVEGYRFLNNRPGKIDGLGPAFFTKWLYFVTARADENSDDAAPVLDALVLTWLADNAGVVLRAGQTADYARYVGLMQSWGSPYGLAPAQVEERIFRLIRNDGDP
ncbi:hypothetical protein ASG23_15445 [Cellulomonas sp. Leaf395]|nr:hypothetical protein ASG23_15445 [Cellulomonas sp. Leaf395]